MVIANELLLLKKKAMIKSFQVSPGVKLFPPGIKVKAFLIPWLIKKLVLFITDRLAWLFNIIFTWRNRFVNMFAQMISKSAW